MSDGIVPSPNSAVAPVAIISTWKLHVAAAIGAFFLGLTDYMRHGAKSTAVLLSDALAPLTSELSLVPAILLVTPVLGMIAAWIFRPSTEREAFALGFAVFSVFALAPEEKPGGDVGTIQVSSAPVETGSLIIGTAYAEQIRAQEGSAIVFLAYEGKPPPATEVKVSNLTGGQRLGSYRVLDSLTLVGNPGDRIQLSFEAPGYERTVTELTLDANTYRVQLKKSGTPLFIQRLTAASRAMALPGADYRARALDRPVGAAVQ